MRLIIIRALTGSYLLDWMPDLISKETLMILNIIEQHIDDYLIKWKKIQDVNETFLIKQIRFQKTLYKEQEK